MIGAGLACALIGSWGLAKLSDFYLRLHGPTQATTLAVDGVLVASGLRFTYSAGVPSLNELLIALFLFLTAPASAHLLIKASLHREQSRAKGRATPALSLRQGPGGR